MFESLRHNIKYFNIKDLNRAITLIKDRDNTNEHVTSRATLGMINNYFKLEDNWHVVPEQAQVFNKKPDYVIQKYRDITDDFKLEVFVKVKSLINSNFTKILDQLADSVLFTLDYYRDTFSCFMIAMKGTKIAFYIYHNSSDILDNYNICHYRGFVPINYLIPFGDYNKTNS